MGAEKELWEIAYDCLAHLMKRSELKPTKTSSPFFTAKGPFMCDMQKCRSALHPPKRDDARGEKRKKKKWKMSKTLINHSSALSLAYFPCECEILSAILLSARFINTPNAHSDVWWVSEKNECVFILIFLPFFPFLSSSSLSVKVYIIHQSTYIHSFTPFLSSDFASNSFLLFSGLFSMPERKCQDRQCNCIIHISHGAHNGINRHTNVIGEEWVSARKKKICQYDGKFCGFQR